MDDQGEQNGESNPGGNQSTEDYIKWMIKVRKMGNQTPVGIKPRWESIHGRLHKMDDQGEKIGESNPGGNQSMEDYIKWMIKVRKMGNQTPVGINPWKIT